MCDGKCDGCPPGDCPPPPRPTIDPLTLTQADRLGRRLSLLETFASELSEGLRSLRQVVEALDDGAAMGHLAERLERLEGRQRIDSKRLEELERRASNLERFAVSDLGRLISRALRG